MYLGVPHFYSLTAKGLREIGVIAKVYRPSHTTAMHFVGVSDIAAYMGQKYGLDAVSDFYVDKDFYHNKEVLRQYKLEYCHKPDIIFTKGATSYFVEYERTRKGRKKTMENILMNYSAGVQQIWVLGDIPFGDIKKECAEDPYYRESVAFMDYVDIVRELKGMGGVKDES